MKSSSHVFRQIGTSRDQVIPADKRYLQSFFSSASPKNIISCCNWKNSRPLPSCFLNKSGQHLDRWQM